MNKLVVFIGITTVAFILHSFLQIQLISLVMWPLVISWFLAYAYPNKTFLLVILIAISELFSWATPGVMTAVVLIPFMLLYINKLPPVDISFSFLFLLALLVFLQIVIITLWVNWPITWQSLPIMPILIATAGTSIISGVAVIVSDS